MGYGSGGNSSLRNGCGSVHVVGVETVSASDISLMFCFGLYFIAASRTGLDISHLLRLS
jgi:hypothetical protein